MTTFIPEMLMSTLTFDPTHQRGTPPTRWTPSRKRHAEATAQETAVNDPLLRKLAQLQANRPAAYRVAVLFIDQSLTGVSG